MKKILALALAAGLALTGGAFAQAPNFDDPAEFARQKRTADRHPDGSRRHALGAVSRRYA